MTNFFHSKSSQKLFSLILIELIFLPLLTFANVLPPSSVPYPLYDWPKIVLFSLLASLIMFLIWLLSPLGIIFILSSLAQFLIAKKAIRILAWIFQGLVLASTALLGIAVFVLVSSLYGQEKYIFLIGAIGALSLVFLLICGVIIAQIIWQKRK